MSAGAGVPAMGGVGSIMVGSLRWVSQGYRRSSIRLARSIDRSAQIWDGTAAEPSWKSP
jgi:hypothetical protein